MNLKISICILLCTISLTANAQEVANDSLNNYEYLKKNIYKHLANGNKVKAQFFAYTYLKKAKLDDTNLLYQVKGHEYVAGVTSVDNALPHLDSMVDICEREGRFNFYHIKAYLYKGGLYFNKQRSFTKAFDNYMKALELAETYENERMVAVIKNTLGVIKLENVGQEEEALALIKEAESFYKRPPNNDKYTREYLSILFSLSSTYNRLNELDMATKYNEIGLAQAQKYARPKFEYLFYLNKGIVQYLNGSYAQAITLVQKGEAHFKKINDFGNLIEAHYYLGSSFKKLGRIEEALFHLEKLDSIQEKNSFNSLQGRKGLEELIDHYKKEKNPLKELEYVNKLLSLDSIHINNYISISNAMSTKYDHKNLLNEKSLLEQQLTMSSKKSTVKSYILVGLSLLFMAIFYYFRQKQKSLKRKFDALIEKNGKVEQPLSRNRKKLDISDEIVNEILANLEKFEQDLGFLKPDLNSQQLAKKINTNTKYLSQVINAKKEKTIIKYINDLRIDYTIERLKNEQLFRKYSIRSIAEEVGFSNPTSFAQSFSKYTNLKPSYFIKELIRTTNS